MRGYSTCTKERKLSFWKGRGGDRDRQEVRMFKQEVCNFAVNRDKLFTTTEDPDPVVFIQNPDPGPGLT